MTSVAANGFEVREEADVAASPAHVYRALILPSRWWDPAHSYSGKAANLTLEPRAGGCWCERLTDGGSVQHLVVVNATSGKLLRLRGALGPLQGMGVDGALSIKIESSPAAGNPAAGSHVTLTYAVGGYASQGFEQIAKTVDEVLSRQLTRLKRLIETGRPTA